MALTMRDSWTDERLDDFRDEVNRRFDEAERRTDLRFDDVDRQLEKLDSRFYDLQRVIMITGGGVIVTLLGVIATGIAT
jgi:hypothetical protein